MSTIIRELLAEPLDLPLWEPFKIATGIKDAAWNVLIRIVLEDGTTGFGEVSPSPYTTGDTRETVIAVMDQLRPAVIGKDIFDRSSVPDLKIAPHIVDGIHLSSRLGPLDYPLAEVIVGILGHGIGRDRSHQTVLEVPLVALPGVNHGRHYVRICCQ